MRNFDREYTKLYTALCATPTAGNILRARLLCIIQRAGKTPTGLAVEMGRDRKTWGRKLNANHGEPRVLTVEDIDAILKHLELKAWEILRPVLFDGDRKILDAVRSYKAWTDLVKDNDPDSDALKHALWRLRAQGLIGADDRHDTIRLTRLGRAALRR